MYFNKILVICRNIKVLDSLIEWWLRRHRRAERSYPTLKVRNSGGKEIPLIQGKEQRLCLAGAAVRRYPTPKVRETQLRW